MLNKGWILFLIVALACAAPPPPAPQAPQNRAPAREADIRGTVTHVEANTLRVEAEPKEFRGAKAVVTLTPNTVARTASGNAVPVSSIREGQVVRVWFTGAVANSYPLQAEAGEIVVE